MHILDERLYQAGMGLAALPDRGRVARISCAPISRTRCAICRMCVCAGTNSAT